MLEPDCLIHTNMPITSLLVGLAKLIQLTTAPLAEYSDTYTGPVTVVGHHRALHELGAVGQCGAHSCRSIRSHGQRGVTVPGRKMGIAHQAEDDQRVFARIRRDARRAAARERRIPHAVGNTI